MNDFKAEVGEEQNANSGSDSDCVSNYLHVSPDFSLILLSCFPDCV